MAVGRLRALTERAAARIRRPPAPGVNVVGYFDRTSGLADRARQLVSSLRLAGIEVGEWSVPDGDAPAPRRAVYDTTIAVVTAVQLAGVVDRLPVPFERASRRIGYYFWELADIPDDQRWGIGFADEIWTPTEFVRAAYAAATDRPVRLVPLPVAAPARDGHGRDTFGFRAAEVVFLVSFDFRSTMERKNPAAAVTAFRRAFPDGDEPVRLVIKTLNGDERPDDMRRLTALTSGDPRVEVRDEQLAPGAMADLLAAADVFVSLHRSEGLGLQLVEAMWLGTPVIATAYSGNLDVTAPPPDGDVAELIPATIVPVTGGGEAYTAGSWAEPDVDLAAAAMRRLATDPARREELAGRARRNVEVTNDPIVAAALLRDLLG